MTTLRSWVSKLLENTEFRPSFLAIFLNPYYLVRRNLWNEVQKIAPAINGRVLDFGSGSKPYESLFKCEAYIGVDVEVSGHDHAKSKIDYFWNGKILPFPDNSFDAVLAFEVFEHVPNGTEMLGELRRVLKPGGRLIMSTPFMFGEHEAPYDFVRYTSFGLENLVTMAGFEIRSIKKLGNLPQAIGQIMIDYLTIPYSRIKYLPFALGLLLAPSITILSLLGSLVCKPNNEGKRYFLGLFLDAESQQKKPTVSS